MSVVLEEASLKKGTELVPETQCIVFPYIPRRKSKKLLVQILSDAAA
jgi:hypothetical protein